MMAERRSDRPADGPKLQFAAELGPGADRATAPPSMTWQVAHRIANISAAQAAAALGVDLNATAVDVDRAIGMAGVALVWRAMPTVFGAYINEPTARPGILINNGLPLGARRQTAAHELGHHWSHHTTSVDDDSTIDTTEHLRADELPKRGRRRRWTDQEKVAEAFGSWFLMPRKIVLNALNVLGLSRPQTALDAYRLSLLLGTSYRTTVQHLPNLRLTHPRTAAAWGAVSPAELKARIDGGWSAPASRRPNVWQIDDRFDGASIVVEPGDRIVVQGTTEHDPITPPWLARLGRRQDRHAFVVSPTAEVNEGVIEIASDAGVCATVVLNTPQPLGVDQRRWT